MNASILVLALIASSNPTAMATLAPSLRPVQPTADTSSPETPPPTPSNILAAAAHSKMSPTLAAFHATPTSRSASSREASLLHSTSSSSLTPATEVVSATASSLLLDQNTYAPTPSKGFYFTPLHEAKEDTESPSMATSSTSKMLSAVDQLGKREDEAQYDTMGLFLGTLLASFIFGLVVAIVVSFLTLRSMYLDEHDCEQTCHDVKSVPSTIVIDASVSTDDISPRSSSSDGDQRIMVEGGETSWCKFIASVALSNSLSLHQVPEDSSVVFFDDFTFDEEEDVV